MSQESVEALQFYAIPGAVTDPGELAGWLDGLPMAIPELCRIVQGLLIHTLEGRRYGLVLSDERQAEVRIGTVGGILARVLELSPWPLTLPRPPELRVVATCHDFSILLCAMLRAQRRPARPRAGFATYLVPGRYIDHWLCEVWDPAQARWLRVDAQLDDVHRRGYTIDFDPCDVPAERYLTAGEAWRACRQGQADAQRFGFHRWWGWGYLRHSVLRDLLALNKHEGLPWESAGLREVTDEAVTAADATTLDAIAALTSAGNGALPALRASYQQVLSSGSPPDWRPWRLEDVADNTAAWMSWQHR